MRNLNFFFAFLLFVSVVAALPTPPPPTFVVEALPTPTPPPSPAFVVKALSPPPPPPNHFYLVVTWPYGFCSFNRCRYQPLPSAFPIHGLWPVNETFHVVEFCGLRQGNMFREVRKREDVLYHRWVSFIADSSKESQMNFWTTEYIKHGTCDPSTVGAYFDKAITAYEKYGLVTAFVDMDMYPGNTYSSQDFETAVRVKYGVGDIMLQCLWTNDGRQILTQIFLCLDSTGTTLISCTPLDRSPSNDNCGAIDIELLALTIPP